MSDFGDYVERLRGAQRSVESLLAVAEQRLSQGDYQTQHMDLKEVMRLRGKVEGIKLAISYAEEGF